ncbi:MAG: nucleoside triphosphate pyrophosphohydrolase [Bacteroidales bacterium]|nr:nucleoside triphosphate pyrophosphohydrolase [Bacteroidales bacterium]
MSDAFERLSSTLDTLRKECPWDKKQTLQSLRYLTIEEVNELSEAIVALEVAKENCDEKERAILVDNLKKELGDVAMHVLFYAKIAEDEGLFTVDDVYNGVVDKLIKRHPFIYDKGAYGGENWEQLKMREGNRAVLAGVPQTLPTLVKTVRMQEKVAGVKSDDAQNIDNADIRARFEHLVEDGPTTETFGELLFAIVDWGRVHGINADDALSIANRRFYKQHENLGKK